MRLGSACDMSLLVRLRQSLYSDLFCDPYLAENFVSISEFFVLHKVNVIVILSV